MLALLLQLTVSAPLLITDRCVPSQLGACFSITMQTFSTVTPGATPIEDQSFTTLVMRVQNAGTGPFALTGLQMWFPGIGNAYDLADPRRTPGPNCGLGYQYFLSTGYTCNQIGFSVGNAQDDGTPENGATSTPQPSPFGPFAAQWVALFDLGQLEIQGAPILGCNPVVDPNNTGYLAHYSTCGTDQWMAFKFHTFGAWDVATDFDAMWVSTTAGACAIQGPQSTGRQQFADCENHLVTPEPVTMLLVGTGLAGIAWRRRRRETGQNR